MAKSNISILLNLLIVIFEVFALVMSVNVNHRASLEYYTFDSNILALVSSLIFVLYLIFKKKIPRWLRLFKYTTTICLAVTFFVVLFILAPMYDFNYGYMLLYNSLLFQHLLCPIFSIITFIFFDDIGYISIKDSFIGLNLTIIYAFVLVLLNLFDMVSGPYPFLMVKDQGLIMSFVWLLVIFSLAYFISFLLRKLRLRFSGKGEEDARY